MLKVVVVQGRTDSLSVMSVRFIKVKVEISEEYEFMRKKAIMVQKGVKLRKEHGCCKLVFSAGRGAIETTEGN